MNFHNNTTAGWSAAAVSKSFFWSELSINQTEIHFTSLFFFFDRGESSTSVLKPSSTGDVNYNLSSQRGIGGAPCLPSFSLLTGSTYYFFLQHIQVVLIILLLHLPFSSPDFSSVMDSWILSVCKETQGTQTVAPNVSGVCAYINIHNNKQQQQQQQQQYST
jgi:hypothetical protein